MRKNPGYILTELGGSPYLLPFGQMIVEHRHALCLNETAQKILEELTHPMDRGELLARLRNFYEVEDTDEPGFTQDMNTFLDQLLLCGVLLADTPEQDLAPEADIREQTGHSTMAADSRVRPMNTGISTDTDHTAGLLIAGCRLMLSGPPEAFSEEFKDFLTDPFSGEPIDQAIYVHTRKAPETEGICLLHDPNLTVHEKQGAYHLCFPASSGLEACLLSKDGTRADFFVHPPMDDMLRYDLFHAIRTTFLYLAAGRGMYALHSASILYRGKAWLFSGPSGTGKSTHTGLWQKYVNTPYINGDLNLLSLDADGSPIIRGIPWCGTSGICDNLTHSLGGIVLLKQDSMNQLYPLKMDEQQIGVLQRLISPRWDGFMLQRLVDFTEKICPLILVRQLGCTISKEAVSTIRSEIDRICS